MIVVGTSLLCVSIIRSRREGERERENPRHVKTIFLLNDQRFDLAMTVGKTVSAWVRI